MISPPPRRPPAPPLLAHFDAFGFAFRFSSRSALARRFLQRLYHAFAVEKVGDEAPTFHLVDRKSGEKRSWEVFLGDEYLGHHPSLGAALRHLEYEICVRIIASRADLVVVHGATVFSARGATLLSGRSGAGKSTLSLALAALGYRVGGDDVALLDPKTGAIRPLPRCFHLDAHSRRLLGRAGLRMPTAAARHGFLTPADLGMTEVPTAPVRWALLLDRGVERRPCLTPASQAEMTARLLHESRWNDHGVPELLSALRRLVGEAACYSLVGGRLRGTAEVVAGLLGPA